MAGTTCPNCHVENYPGAARCKHCGADLRRAPIILHQETGLMIGGRELPAKQLKAVAASVAVSVIALLAEAGIIWLRRRVQQMQFPIVTDRQAVNLPAVLPEKAAPVQTHREVTTVISERVIEERRWGRSPRRIIERFAWRREESRE